MSYTRWARGGQPVRPAFSLVELLVVISVLAVLATLVTLAANAFLNNQRNTNTQATFKILEQAIAIYATEVEPPSSAYRNRYRNLPPDGYSLRVPESFGSGGWSDPSPDDNNSGYYEAAWARNDLANQAVIQRYQYVGGSWVHAWPDTIFHSIEAFHLYATQLSPGAGDILKQLPRQYVTNQDRPTGGAEQPDLISIDRNNSGDAAPPSPSNPDEQIELVEITDAWGNPLRYYVRHSLLREDAGTHAMRWELRSAGPDEKFVADHLNAAFNDAEKSDDIVLRGP